METIIHQLHTPRASHDSVYRSVNTEEDRGGKEMIGTSSRSVLRSTGFPRKSTETVPVIFGVPHKAQP